MRLPRPESCLWVLLAIMAAGAIILFISMAYSGCATNEALHNAAGVCYAVSNQLCRAVTGHEERAWMDRRLFWEAVAALVLGPGWLSKHRVQDLFKRSQRKEKT